MEEGAGADEVTKIIPRGVEDRFTSEEGDLFFFPIHGSRALRDRADDVYTYVVQRGNRGFISGFYGRTILYVMGLL